MKEQKQAKKSGFLFSLIRWRSTISSILFMAVVCLLFMVFVFGPKKSFSDVEKRQLQSLPKLSWSAIKDGTFTREFELYCSDQFPFRRQFMGVKHKADQFFMRSDNGRVFFGKKDNFIAKPDPVEMSKSKRNQRVLRRLEEAVQSGKCPQPKLMLIPTAGITQRSWLPYKAPVFDDLAFIAGVKENYPDLKHVDLSELVTESYALAEKLDARPAQLVTEGTELPAATDSQLPKVDRLNQQLVYYRTDHHWTSRGAYLAAKAYLQTLGVQLPEEVRYQKEAVSQNFLGSSYAKVLAANTKPDTIEIWQNPGQEDLNQRLLVLDKEGKVVRKGLFDPEKLTSYDPYEVFLGGNEGFLHLFTGLNTKRQLLVFKDSFTNAMLPFLTPYFDHIYVVDPRFEDEGIKALLAKFPGINEILVAYNAETFVTDRNIYKIEDYSN